MAGNKVLGGGILSIGGTPTKFIISVINDVFIRLSKGLDELREQHTFTSNNQALKVLSRMISNPYNSKQLFLCSFCLLIG